MIMEFDLDFAALSWSLGVIKKTVLVTRVER